MQHKITQISKTISHALRHAPAEYGLTLDPQGWVLIADLLAALQSRGMQADESMLHAILAQSEKKRFEMVEGKIRAYYGHSTEEKIVKQVVEPPEILYHGTVTGNLESILEKGLLPMGRQYVHLSADEKTAKMVGSRHAGAVVILQVQARAAYNAGIAFYQENNGVWLSDAVPGGYLSVVVL